ncbi:MAG: hypothetical protein RJA70_3523 [Pseudomonadota bacterium]|jgi:hypothetical protein
MARLKTALVAFAAASVFSSAASAGITRYSEGKFVWNSVTIVTESGAHLQSIAPDATTMYTHYVTARGYHGGRDNAANRIEAKNRANAKAISCLLTFFSFATTDERYQPNCNVGGDVWVNSAYSLDANFSAFAQGRWCSAGRQAASARGIAGPVYLNISVGLWADAAGTEADNRQDAGSVSMIPCF